MKETKNNDKKADMLSFEEVLELVSERRKVLKVVELLITDQKSGIVEVYNEYSNVVLKDDGDCNWTEDKLVFKGNRLQVISCYGLESVYRWQKDGHVMKLCLGNVAKPDSELIDEGKEWIDKFRPI